MPSLRSGSARSPFLIALSLGAVLALSGCATEAAPEQTPQATASAPAPAPEQAAPELVPDGDAAANLPFFDQVVQTVWADGNPVTGRTYVDALAGAGFDRAAMQVTFDETSLGGEADSIQFSVLWGDSCLIGQVGPSIGGAVTRVMPQIRGGSCLVGQTRPIDW